MKTLRIALLVLLAVLLPVRGAVAGAMLCHAVGAAAAPPGAAERHDHATHGGHGMHGDHAVHDQAGATDSETGPADGRPAGAHAAAACQFCVSGCCMASLPFDPPSIAPPGVTASVSFPALAVPVPAFESGGLERPPRSC